MTSDRSPDFTNLLETLLHRKWLIIAAAILAGVGAYALSQTQEDRYEASAQVLFRRDELAELVSFENNTSEDNRAPERTAATNVAIAETDEVSEATRRLLRTDASIDDIKKNIRINPVGQADLIEVTGIAQTPRAATLLANTYAGRIVIVRKRRAQRRVERALDAINVEVARGAVPPTLVATLRRRADQLRVLRTAQTGDAELAQAARPPDGRASPQPKRDALIAAVVAAFLAAIAALLLSRLDRRVRDEHELVELLGAPVLGRVPRRSGRLGNQRAERAFQFLRANLQYEEGVRSIAAVSAVAGEGRTTVVAGLGRALAAAGSRTIAVDGDVRHPSLHEELGVENDVGLIDSVERGRDITEAVHATSLADLELVPAGQSGAEGGLPALGRRRLADALAPLGDTADLLLFDTAPLLAAADGGIVGSVADGVVVVVDLRRGARREDLIAARDQLTIANCRIVGIVLNRTGRRGVSDGPVVAPPAAGQDREALTSPVGR